MFATITLKLKLKIATILSSKKYVKKYNLTNLLLYFLVARLEYSKIINKLIMVHLLLI